MISSDDDIEARDEDVGNPDEPVVDDVANDVQSVCLVCKEELLDGEDKV